MLTIVYGHPYDQSFNAAIRDAVLAGVESKGREYALIDLYADNFDAAVREADLALYNAGRTADALAQKYMGILGQTDAIIYIFPVWWGVEPAIVKGFHDKVLLKDFAWIYSQDGRLLPRLKIGQTMLFTTSDAPTALFQDYFCKYLPEHVFEQVGMGNVSWHNFENIGRSTEAGRKAFLAQARELAAGLA